MSIVHIPYFTDIEIGTEYSCLLTFLADRITLLPKLCCHEFNMGHYENSILMANVDVSN